MFKSYLSKFLGSWDASLLHDEAGGGGTGTGAGAGGGSGAGAGGGAPAAGAGTGAGAPSTYVLSADSMVDLGDGKPVKWSDVTNPDTGRYVSRDRYTAGVQYLQTEAQRLQAAWDEYHKGAGGRPNKPEPAASGPDPLDGIRDMPVVDGRTLERLYQQLQTNGFGPVAQIIAKLAAKVQQLEGGLSGVGKTTQQLAGREGEQQFESFITKSFSDAGPIKGLPEGVSIDGNDPALREMAKDLYLSHEANSWKPGEFAKSLNKRVEAAITLVRGLDKKAVEAAQQRKKVWLNPNRGAANPQGKTPFRFQRGAEVARQFFGGDTQNT